MTAHTPGPWQVLEGNGDDYTEGGLYIEADKAGRDVCDIHHRRPGHASAEDEANARLIAAAPEMLQALLEAVSWIGGQINSANEVTPYDFKVYAQVREAIAKAKGIET